MASSETSNDAKVPAVRGENTAGGVGVSGESGTFHAIVGLTHSGFAGVFGTNDSGGTGVAGESKTGRGVHGLSVSNTAVNGQSTSGRGIHGESDSNTAVNGQSKSGFGVHGQSESNTAVLGQSNGGFGVHGQSESNTAVLGQSKRGRGVDGQSETDIGVYGKGGRLAGFFEGDVEVSGDIRLANADCAEDFDVSGTYTVDPGTVMVLGNEGAVSVSQQAYDKRVAGVISGAGDYKPGIVLDKRQSSSNRQPVALMGKVFCKVDAQYGAIEVGDLLTTSPTPGHAMTTSDPIKAFGAVIGKALQPHSKGQGLIPILIALQ